jgi:hypothetical protein
MKHHFALHELIAAVDSKLPEATAFLQLPLIYAQPESPRSIISVEP